MAINPTTKMWHLSDYAAPGGTQDATSGWSRLVDDITAYAGNTNSLYWDGDYSRGGTILVDGSFRMDGGIDLSRLNAIRVQGLGQWHSRLYSNGGNLLYMGSANGVRDMVFRDLSLQTGPDGGGCVLWVNKGFVVRSAFENVRMRSRRFGYATIYISDNAQMHATNFRRVELDRMPQYPGGPASPSVMVTTMHHGFNNNHFDTVWVHGNNATQNAGIVLQPPTTSSRYVGNVFTAITGEQNGAGLIHAAYQKGLIIDAAREWDYSVDGVNKTPYTKSIIRLTGCESDCFVRSSGRAMSTHPLASGASDVQIV